MKKHAAMRRPLSAPRRLSATCWPVPDSRSRSPFRIISRVAVADGIVAIAAVVDATRIAVEVVAVSLETASRATRSRVMADSIATRRPNMVGTVDNKIRTAVRAAISHRNRITRRRPFPLHRLPHLLLPRPFSRRPLTRPL